MKNAGMAGAVALVGIGLLSIGTFSVAEMAGASTRSVNPSASAKLFPKVQNCPVQEQADWFDPLPRLMCDGQGLYPTLAVLDIDGDGRTDNLPPASNGVLQTLTWTPGCCGGQKGWSGGIFAWTFQATEEQTMLAEIDVGSALIPGLSSLIEKNCRQSFDVAVLGVADVDGDARFDLVVRVLFNCSDSQVHYWFRNTASADPLVADINGDGFVNGADMGLLIAAWTG